MVYLIVGDYQLTLEEWLLEKWLTLSDIKYEIIISCGDGEPLALPTPHLMVDGVPLDYQRAIKWINDTTEIETKYGRLIED